MYLCSKVRKQISMKVKQTTAEKKLLRLAPASGHVACKDREGRRLTQLNVRGLCPN